MLGRRYRIRASEEVTSLCPRRLCPHVKRRTKHSVLHELATGRPERFEAWVRSIRATRRPILFFKHVLLPHGPWRFLPDGARYVGRDPVPDWGHAFSVPWVATQKYQRHLLQLSFCDRLLGSLIARLKAEGLYDRALIVVSADNGESFGRIGNGHEVSASNAGDIALTPLIVKAPLQHDGSAPARHVRTLDVVPTVARIAHMRSPWPMQGRSVYGGAARRIPSTATIFQRSGRSFSFSPGALRRWARAARRRKLALFGSGDGGPGLYGIGPYRRLIGSSPSSWPASTAQPAHATLNGARAFEAVRRDASFIPAYASGRISGSRPPAVAIAINGTIGATSPTYRIHGKGPYFSAALPPAALRDGANQIRLYAVSGTGETPRLTPLPG